MGNIGPPMCFQCFRALIELVLFLINSSGTQQIDANRTVHYLISSRFIICDRIPKIINFIQNYDFVILMVISSNKINSYQYIAIKDFERRQPMKDKLNLKDQHHLKDRRKLLELKQRKSKTPFHQHIWQGHQHPILLSLKNINVQTSNIDTNNNRDNNKILIRKNKVSIYNHKTAYNNFRYTSNRLTSKSQINEASAVNKSNIQTQKQRFITELQQKVLRSVDSSINVYTNHQQVKTNQLNRYEQSKESRLKTFRSFISPNKSEEQQKEDFQDKNYLSVESKKFRMSYNKEENNPSSFRERAKTITKEIVKNIQDNFQARKHNDFSRTIQINPQQFLQRMKKTLQQIEEYEAKNKPFENPSNQEDKQLVDGGLNCKNEDVKSSLNNSIRINNTQTFQEQINNLTHQYFSEWNKMNATKNQIYQHLRNKLIKTFPSMKKHYIQYSLPKQQQAENSPTKKSDQFYNITNELQSSIKISHRNLNSSNNSISNHLSCSQIKDYQEKFDLFNQKKLLREIFKRAYFWSRTKKQYMDNSVAVQKQGINEHLQLRNIQKNLTFIKYMKNKTNRSSILTRKSKIKGSNIIKNQESILQLEREGTKEQSFLKKCLDSAIQDCIRQWA